ncbi:MAG: mannitol dehydrogenase family protein [Aestuariivirga sp.]
MAHLSRAILAQLPAHVRKPTADLSQLDTGIVHLGVGAFHRAHQAVYTEDVIEDGDTRWGTVGASLRAADTRDALRPQDWLYSLSESDQSRDRLRVIGSLKRLLVAPENPSVLLHAMCNPSVKIVSLTVTEKGYCHDPATGALNEDHADVQHDLTNPDSPKSAPGFITRAIALRRLQGLPPFAVLCCDNLPSNGQVARRVISRLGSLHDGDLGKYITDTVAFPSTMVDRIVPATTDADRAAVANTLGVVDNWPVMTEAFTQWVIEDHFPSGRPDWAATFVSDVTPFETMKLRLLNGSHSCIAYLGYLAGYETVADAMQNQNLAHFVKCFMDIEAAPTLSVPAGTDVEGYKAALIKRFRNPSLRHRTWQIAMDGSQKLPQRFLGTIRDQLKTGGPITCLALGVAAWMRYVTGVDERHNPIDVRDPLRDELRKRADAAGLDAARLAPALINIEAIFGKDLPAHEGFVAAVTSSLDRLIKQGARQSLLQTMKHAA